tara:strand:- start:353 stop:568 length:216 start_codon:yes stop_codon:yes gene_type:complete
LIGVSLLEVLSTLFVCSGAATCSGAGCTCVGGCINLRNATSNVPSNSPDFLSISSDSKLGFFALTLSDILS